MFGDEPFVYVQGWQGRFPGWTIPPVGTVLKSVYGGRLLDPLYVVTRKGIQKVYPDGTTPEGATGTGGEWKIVLLGTGKALSANALKVLLEKNGKIASDRLTDRYLIRKAARQVYASSFHTRTASLRDLTPQVLAAFAEGFYMPSYTGRVAFGGILKKLTALVSAFKKAPKLWSDIKSALGIESITDLPGAIKKWAADGYNALKKVIHVMFQKFPLMLYTLEKGKLKGVSDIIEHLMKQFPQVQAWFSTNVKPKVDQFDQWIRAAAPIISGVLTAAIYIWVWFNVVEFEWDWHSIVLGFTGHIGIGDLLGSLPSSGLGFLLNGFGFGTFTLLPALTIARIVYLMMHRYLTWTGSGFKFETGFCTGVGNAIP